MSTPPHIEARRLITCWPSLFRPAEGRRVDSRALFERAKNPRTYANKDDVGRWSGGVFHGDYRSLSRFDRGEWLVLDFDLATTRRRVVEAFVGLRGMAHTTWTSTPENPRWRVAVVLSRAVTRNEHDRVWRAGASMAERGRLTPDYAARDASRAWALPARHVGDHYEHTELEGAPFDVDCALAEYPEPSPEPVTALSWPTPDDVPRRIERASRYVETLPPAIAGSGGHAAAFKAAVVLVRGFDLAPEYALRILVEQYNPRCLPPWSLLELKHKVKSAAARARLERGWLANRPLRRTA